MKQPPVILLVLLAMLALAACGGATPAEPGADPSATTLPDQPTTEPTSPETPTAEPPTAAPTEVPTTEPAATPVTTPEALCPDLPRPALILSTGSGFEAQNPLSGERCPLPLPETMGYLQPGGDRLYFVASDSEAGTNVVARLGAGGTVEPLEPTRATGDVYYLLRFAVAADESRLAWSRMATQDATATAMQGSLWIGTADGSAATPIFENQLGGELRIVTPLRFTADDATLYFTWEPIGLGGAWNGFNGRYDNLYRVPVAGGAPEKVFDCADMGLFLCAGDFLDDGTVAYIDTNRVIHVARPDGVELAAIPTTAEYAGYPTFSPTGDLYYSEAVLLANNPNVAVPAPGTVYRLAAPYSGAPALVATADGLLPPASRRPFLDADHLVVGYFQNEMWGTAVLSSAGDIMPLEPWPSAYLAAVWPAKQ